MSGREAMIARAERSLGIVGTPNSITRSYAARNGSYYRTAPWCNQAITEWARDSGNYQAVNFGTDYAYTVYHAQRFQAAGRWHVDIAGIQRGDVLFFDWNGSNSIGNIDHVGLVTSVNGRDVFTIEGNTANGCRRRVRGSASIVGYGRPAYTAASPAPKPTPTPAGLVRFPGEDWFRSEPKSPIVTAMGKRLVAVGCGRYEDGPGPQWTSADRESYKAWQRKCGYTGSNADGWPGEDSWNRLKVPTK